MAKRYCGMIRKTKKRLEAKLANNVKTDPKAYYRYANSKMGVKESVGELRGQKW